ncbi:hypothetical protein [Argonema galeatum]|nr:hypothetical protein [Argonema galeatum]MCL1467103.1 hypothetical protein [Argonema galeatum A003/A1]
MTIYQMLDSVTLFFSAVARIFSPTDDAYPEIGVQPFDGDSFKESNTSDW